MELTNNNNIMKTLLKKVLEAVIVLLSIFILGLMLPMLTSLIFVIFSNTQFDECIHTGQFWLFTILGWIVAGCYIGHVYDENKINV